MADKTSSKNGKAEKTLKDVKRLQTLSQLTNRAALSGGLGLSHQGERDLYDTLGYPSSIDVENLMAQWKRHDMARALVDRPVKKTWQGDIRIEETEQEGKTDLETAFSRLDPKVQIKNKLLRVDRLAQLGEYAVLLLGFDDSGPQQWTREPTGGRELKYVRPVSRKNASIKTYQQDTSHARFGKPQTYGIDFDTPTGEGANETTTKSLIVHHSRIIHVAFNLLENEIEGVPILKTGFNRLKDLEKLVGGGAEMFWRGARPGYFGSAKEDYSVGDEAEKDLREQLDEYENDLRRFLIAEGVDIQSLEQQISDPESHVRVQVQMLSALSGIPARILIGSESGELASSQDRTNWHEFLQARRTEEAGPKILRPLIDRLIKYGALPEAKEKEGYSIRWADLFSVSEKAKSDIAAKRSDALSKYYKNPALETELPFEAFLRYFLKMDEDQVNDITSMRDSAMSEELGREAELEQDTPSSSEEE
jgi:hypothetical protein